MMAEPEVLVRPSHPEWDERLDDYHEVVAALRDQGIDANLADMAVPPSGSDLPEFVPLAFAIFVAHKVADAILATIIEEVRRVLVSRARIRWAKKGKTVRGVIYGQNGEILHEFTMHAAND